MERLAFYIANKIENEINDFRPCVDHTSTFDITLPRKQLYRRSDPRRQCIQGLAE